MRNGSGEFVGVSQLLVFWCLSMDCRTTFLALKDLLFPDDTLVFCELNEDQLTHLWWLPTWFEVL